MANHPKIVAGPGQSIGGIGSHAEIQRMIEQAKQAEEARRYSQYEDLLKAMGSTVYSPYRAAPIDLNGLGAAIKDRIAYHEKMIATLQWFGAHVGIDNPETKDLMVAEVILAGLDALAKRIDGK